MLNHLRNRDQQVAEQLRRQAGNDRPAFSADLHERIMQTVRANPQRPQRQTDARQWSGWTWSLAVAATVMVAASAALWTSAPDHQSVAQPTMSNEHLPNEHLPKPSGVSPSQATVTQATVTHATVSQATGAVIYHATPALARQETVSQKTGAGEASSMDGLKVVTGLYDVAFNQFDAFQQGEKTVEARLIDQQLAMLDHDARVVAGWVLDPLAISIEN
jgi:hypothetical protein